MKGASAFTPVFSFLESVGFVVHQGQEFVAGVFAGAESAQHGAGHGAGVLFFDAAHHHAEVTGFADYSHRSGLYWAMSPLDQLVARHIRRAVGQGAQAAVVTGASGWGPW